VRSVLVRRMFSRCACVSCLRALRLAVGDGSRSLALMRWPSWSKPGARAMFLEGRRPPRKSWQQAQNTRAMPSRAIGSTVTTQLTRNTTPHPPQAWMVWLPMSSGNAAQARQRRPGPGEHRPPHTLHCASGHASCWTTFTRPKTARNVGMRFTWPPVRHPLLESTSQAGGVPGARVRSSGASKGGGEFGARRAFVEVARRRNSAGGSKARNLIGVGTLADRVPRTGFRIGRSGQSPGDV